MTKNGKVELWGRIQNGDKIAFNEVYRANVNSLYNYGCSLTSDVHLVEDAIQEIFIAIWIKRASIRIESNIKGYLLTSLRRQVLQQVTKQNRLVENSESIIRKMAEINSQEAVDPRLSMIELEISKLSRREREAIVLKYQGELCYNEISKVMNLKNHAIYKLVSRGVGKIRKNINNPMSILL